MKWKSPRTVAAAGTATAVLLLVAAPSSAQTPSPDDNPLLLPDDLRAPVAMVEPSLLSATGTVTVSLELADPSLSEAVGDDAKQDGPALSPDQQRTHVAELERSQAAVLDEISSLGAEEVITTQLASNLVVVDVDASRVLELAQLPEVTRVLPVTDFELDLAETVPHIGAAALQDNPGLTGDGVAVAVLDTGIDYTHARFGGDGTQAAYKAAYGTSVNDPANTTRDGLFPTAKVVEGFDFLGEGWPTTDPAPDPDPIDCGPSGTPAPCTGGHGSHVSSIIAGNNGVAPGADLYAYKVCSSVSTSCDGVAILQAIEAALDPNGDGDIDDAVDVINLSLGAPYGQVENPSSGATANAVRMGVVVVASAGNSADKPYITGSPSSTPEVISVAQTHVPSALHFNLTATEPADIADVYTNTNTVEWAPITDGFEGQVRYGSTEAERLGCFVDENGEPSDQDTGVSPYPAGFFDGQVAFLDRGLCAISFKVHNAAEAGAVGVVVANNAPGEAPAFSFGGPDPFNELQTIIVGLEVGDALRTGLATGEPVRVSVDPDDATPLVNSLVSTSSRGPSVSEVAIKPDVGAPGASLSAEAGSGTGETAFGGTSGAAPMVVGSVALLLEAYPDRTPLEIKSVLMNTGETEVFINPGTRPGDLAEITRIGGGEVRVDDAHASTTAAWSAEDKSAGLSFGYHSLSRPSVLSKPVTIHNYSDQLRVYRLEAGFRHDDDAASGAVRLIVLPRVVVRPGGSAEVPVIMTIDPRKLPDWVLDGGPNGANGPLLQENELDGYLTISGGGDQVHMPWHVLPDRSSDVRTPDSVRLGNGSANATLFNAALSQHTGSAEVFGLTGTSPQLPDSALPGEGDGFAVVDLAAVGVRSDGEVLQFGFNTHGQRAHPNAPAEFQVLIDNDQDGSPDWLVFNRDLSLGTGDGRNAVFVNEIGTNTATPFFFTEANLNSANAILTVPLAEVGLAAGDQFDFDVNGADWYFTGEVTDSIEDMTFTVGQPRFASDATVEVPAFSPTRLAITEVDGGAEASPSQSGLLLMWRDGLTGAEAATITVR
ncbi:MAG: S8 family serine peptidase [Micromonosporaceae bacterium]|nr:S8 family serine peptidase [Micromonosporaceae bacterium]